MDDTAMPIMRQRFCLDTSDSSFTAEKLMKFTTEYRNIPVCQYPPATDTEEASWEVPLLNGIAQCNSYTVHY